MMKNFLYILGLASIFYFVFLQGPVLAGLHPLENTELDQITGHAGIALAVKDVQIFQNIGHYRYCASDNGYLVFTNIQSDVIRYNFSTADMASGLIYTDVGVTTVASLDDFNTGTNPSGIQKGMVSVVAPDWEQEVSFQTDGFLFSDGTVEYDLGEFWLGQIRKPSFRYYLAPHAGCSGLDFEYDFQMHIDGFAYAYQIDPTDPTNFKSLNFNDIHIGQGFDYGTPGDDPTDPSTWKTDIGEFQIGDMFGNLPDEHSRPAQIDAGVQDFGAGYLEGTLRLRLPMTGSLRFEQAEFGGIDFGPGAIDGIKAYRFNVYMTP